MWIALLSGVPLFSHLVVKALMFVYDCIWIEKRWSSDADIL